MAHAIALARTATDSVHLAEIARVAIVTACGLALMLAGPALPF